MLNITRFSPLEDAFENIFRGIPNGQRVLRQPAAVD